MAAQIDEGDVGHLRAAEASGQHQVAVGPARRLHLGFDGGRRGGEDDGCALLAGPHDGHVAGVVVDALLLLEAGFMGFIDDGDAQILERQEQRRARADDDFCPAIGDGGPGGAAFTGLQIAVP